MMVLAATATRAYARSHKPSTGGMTLKIGALLISPGK
jgi:hypothetical protein